MSNTHQEQDSGYERLIMFTDGIFAIAITLLALEIRIPEVETRAAVGQAILNLLPQIFVFVLSFLQVGIFWLAHHKMFKEIERSDGTFMWLCLIYLMLIAFLPVPSGTLARYGDTFASVVFFAATLILVGLLELAIWQYATHNRRLVKATTTDLEIREERWRTLNVILTFGVSILIAFISPLLAMLSWLSLFVTRRLITRYFDRLSERGRRP